MEVMIGIALLGLVGTTIISAPLRAFKVAQKDLIHMELERVAGLTFGEVLLKLRQSHPFESFLTTVANTPRTPLSPTTIQMGKLNYEVARAYKVWQRQNHEGDDGYHGKVIIFRILLNDIKSEQKLFIYRNKSNDYA